MTAVWQALVVLAWIVILLLVFAYAALLRDMREVQAGVREGDFTRPPQITAPALQTSNVEGTLALAVDPACASCQPAVAVFTSAATGPDRRIVAGADEVKGWPAAQSVGVVIDRALWDRLRIQSTPMLLRFDPAGVLRERQIVGSARHLEKLLGETS